MTKLKDNNFKVIIYEPTLKNNKFNGYKVVNDFSKFMQISDVVIANRMDDLLKPYNEKIYTRDLYSRD